jgi:mannosyl-3-phosphoglycerate synthase
MRIELPKNVERFGAVRLGDIQKVYELDSGSELDYDAQPNTVIQQIPYREMNKIYRDMAIVVPVKDERLKLIEGVLCGIPHSCLIILVSNSQLAPVDRFNMEKDALSDFCTFVNKHALIVHQKDPAIGAAFRRTGYDNILDDQNTVHDGKAEGMLIGTMLARIAGKKYIGFVDSDNYFPGAVEEYIREYAAGFAISNSNYSMVRISWQSKPKIVESKLFFRKWGRSSANTNALLNKFMSHYIGFETEIIKTGNAGEHALTMDLATNIEYSTGYSIEPFHIVNILERFGGVIESPLPDVMKKCVEIYQIESRNPHLHEAGGKEHIGDMQHKAMQVIYHSPICPPDLKKEIRRDAIKKGFVPKDGADVERPRYFPPLSTIDGRVFLDNIASTHYGKLIKNGIGQESRKTLKIV